MAETFNAPDFGGLDNPSAEFDFKFEPPAPPVRRIYGFQFAENSTVADFGGLNGSATSEADGFEFAPNSKATGDYGGLGAEPTDEAEDSSFRKGAPRFQVGDRVRLRRGGTQGRDVVGHLRRLKELENGLVFADVKLPAGSISGIFGRSELSAA